MQEVDLPGGVLGDEEVEEGEGAGVAAEHVVAAGADALQGHPRAGPDGVGAVQLVPNVAVGPEEKKKSEIRIGIAAFTIFPIKLMMI